MKSAKLGKHTSAVEVTNVSEHGFWLLIEGREYFLSFEQFPWFEKAAIGELCQVELPSSHHLYWPALDVDLAVESIENPERFPLVSKARNPTRRSSGRASRRSARR
jgi:hypothetical protein